MRFEANANVLAMRVPKYCNMSLWQALCHDLENTSSPKHCYGQMTAAWSRTLPHVASKASLQERQPDEAPATVRFSCLSAAMVVLEKWTQPEQESSMGHMACTAMLATDVASATEAGDSNPQPGRMAGKSEPYFQNGVQHYEMWKCYQCITLFETHAPALTRVAGLAVLSTVPTANSTWGRRSKHCGTGKARVQVLQNLTGARRDHQCLPAAVQSMRHMPYEAQTSASIGQVTGVSKPSGQVF